MANPANTTAYVGNDGRLWVDVTEAKTVAPEDSGYVQNVIYASGVITLPATATEGMWIIRNGGVPQSSVLAGSGDDGNDVSVDPNGSDTIHGLNVTGTASDGKKLTNTAATAHVGDEICIINSGQTDGGFVLYAKGLWAREA